MMTHTANQRAAQLLILTAGDLANVTLHGRPDIPVSYGGREQARLRRHMMNRTFPCYPI